MSRSKRKQIQKILDKSQISESLKQSFMRAYSAAHRHKKRNSKLCGGA